MTLDVSTDHTIFDGTETVTLTLVRATESSVTVDYALRRAVGRREYALAAGGLNIAPTDTVWHLPASEVGSGNEPLDGDRITQSGGALWVVKSVSLDTLSNRWRCVCGRGTA